MDKSGGDKQKSELKIEDILRKNREPKSRSVMVRIRVASPYEGLKLVAILSEIITGGVYWKIEKEKSCNGSSLTVVGRMERVFTISPDFLKYIADIGFPYQDISNFVSFAEENKMTWYKKDQFETEKKIKEYIDSM